MLRRNIIWSEHFDGIVISLHFEKEGS